VLRAGIYKEGRTFKVVLWSACQTESVDKILQLNGIDSSVIIMRQFTILFRAAYFFRSSTLKVLLKGSTFFIDSGP
jgi:hypothetical protein